MTGIRTAFVFTAVAGLAFVAGRGGVYPSDVLASLAPDGVVMRRLQIVMGHPASLMPSNEAVAQVESPSDALPAAPPAPPVEAPATPRTPPVQLAAKEPPAPAPAEEVVEKPAVDEFTGIFEARERANLRRAPEREGRRLTVIREGEELEVTGRTLDGEWYRIQRGGEEAYVASDLLRPVRIDTPLGLLDFDALDRSIDELDELLRGARFEQVVASAQRLRVRLWTSRRFVSVSAPAVRIESAAGVALVALGRTADAEECFTRALQAQPTLELDSSRFSPKVLRTFEQARTSRS